MSKTARTTRKRALLILTTISMVVVALVQPNAVQATAGSPQICKPGATCEVGEFIYDDNYAPVTSGASCTFTSRYPDGSFLQDAAAMTKSSASDGWYSYSFSAPTTIGMYRTQVCCTVDGSLMCLDKSFEVKDDAGTSGDIASAVWGHSNRTLSSFGTLVSDIWKQSTRSLTTLITKNNTSSSSSSSISSEVDIEPDLVEIRLLLEELVNKPIIETFLENAEDPPDLSAKLEETKTISNQLFVNSQYIVTNSNTLTKDYRRLSSTQMALTTAEMADLLGTQSDSSGDSTIFGQLAWMKEQWDFAVVDDLYDQATSLKAITNSLERKLGGYKTSSSALSDLKRISGHATTFESLIGAVSDDSSRGTLFGKVVQVNELAVDLDQQEAQLDDLLASWGGTSTADKQTKTKDFSRAVNSLNSIPRVRNLIASKIGLDTPDKEVKNNFLGMKGIVQANRIQLASKAGETVSATWLAEGSIVFKTIVTNPSKLIKQTVPLKYYLPPEVKEEHILEIDEPLSVEYDVERDQYFVEGSFELDINETKVLSVKTQDIWVITPEQIDTLKSQAEDLSKPLEKTSFFAQGVTLKSDIDVSLSKILGLQETAFTPEAKIRSYREAQIELAAVSEKMASLQDLVTQAGSAGALMGFVGGAQALAVWGLIIILVAGFVFLAIYMRQIRMGDDKGKVKQPPKVKSKISGKDPFTKGKTSGSKSSIAIRFQMIIFALLTIGVAVAASLVTGKVMSSKVRKLEQQVAQIESQEVLGDEEVVEEPKDTLDIISLQEEEDDFAFGGQDIIIVEVPSGAYLNVRERPSLTSSLVGTIDSGQEVIRLDEVAGWVLVVYESPKLPGGVLEGWVSSDFVIDADDNIFNELDSYDFEEDVVNSNGVGGLGLNFVVVSDTPTGWLRVRESAWGKEIGKVYPGERYPMLSEGGAWFEIDLGDFLGFVHADYVSLE